MSIYGICLESLYSVMNRLVSQIEAYSRDYESANGERLYHHSSQFLRECSRGR